MALGDTNQNSSNEKTTTYSPVTYSPLNFKNPTSKVSSELFFQYWKGTLAIGVAQKLAKKSADEYDKYDRDNAVMIYLNASKARILKMEIDEYLSDKTAFNSVSVCNGTGTSEICVMNGAEAGIDGDIILIRKIDDQGNEVGSLGYEFNNSEKYYFSRRNINLENNSADYKFFRNIELEAFRDLLEDYYRSASYAVAASVNDGMKYTTERINKGLNSLLENAGIATGGKKKPSSGGSFFNRAAEAASGNANTQARANASKQMSVDDFAGEIE